MSKLIRSRAVAESTVQTEKRWGTMLGISLLLVVALGLSGCQFFGANEEPESVLDMSADAGETELEAVAASAHGGHAASTGEHRPELDQAGPIELDPAKGSEIGTVYEAFLSPHQEGGEEEDTPGIIPDVFKSTKESVSRNDRPSHGHGTVAFTNDLSKAYVHVAVEGVELDDIVMFHIHCGRPGQLGPIIIDFALAGDVVEYLADGEFSMEITNEDIEATLDHGEGLIGAFTAGCPIVPANPMDKVKTIAGMEFIARQGELYFNLHTAGQTYFGDIRGQLHAVDQ
ncbi:MAG: CHRD domain-containing protein [Chloroflexota bacterium]